jgi:hypothetical protein
MRLFIMFFIMLSTVALAEAPRIGSNGTVEIAGEQVKCENVRIRLDRNLDNFGVSYPDERLIILNPYQLSYWEGVVQLFVFYHECGHLYNNASETGSDCYAVKRGLEDGWLTRRTMSWVCKSFGDQPAYGPYPSGVRRCAIAYACFFKERKLKRDAVRKSD